MHSSVDLIEDAIDLIKTKHDNLIMAYPDSGYFRSPNWKFEDVITPDHLVEFAAQWQRCGCKHYGWLLRTRPGTCGSFV